MKININKKSVLILSSIVLCAFILLFFLVLHSRSIKNTSVVINSQSGWSSFTGAGEYITAITWDKDNNLWVAGEEFGVSVIPARPDATSGQAGRDDKTIKTFDIPYCYTILCDNDGKVWIGTIREGLYCYDKGKWQNFNVSNGLPSNSIHALAIDKDNNLYCASGLSLSKLSFGKWQTIPLSLNLPTSEISCIDFDKAGNLWVGFSLGGIAKFDGYNWKLYTQKDGLDIDGRINDILVAEDGTVWVAACQGIGKSTFEARDKSFSVYRFEPMHPGYSEKEDPMGWSYYPANYFTSIVQTNSDNIFFVNRHDFIRRWNNPDSRFTPLISQEQLALASRNFFYCITVDKDGYFWVGSYGGGIITNNSSFKFPAKLIKSQIRLAPLEEKTPTIKFSEQPEQKELIAKKYQLLKDSSRREQASYLGEDWINQGNWIGNYGEYAWILPSYYADYNALSLLGGSDRLDLYRFKHLKYSPYLGENRNPDDSIRGWAIPEGEIDYGGWENPRVLQDPLGGAGHNAAWDDHAEAYPRPLIHEGPHIYLDFNILEDGIFLFSFYFMNNDSHEADPMNRFRDYTISVKKKTFSEKQFNESPLLASCRVHDFRAGVYKRFILKGSGEYTIKIDKNESFNTMIWGIFVDKIEEP